jgi:hypothetical protein
MVVHVMAEAHLTVVLLFADHTSFVGELKEKDLLLLVGDEHEHAGGEIATGKGILSKESQWLEVGHIGVEHDKGDVVRVQLIGILLCDLQVGGYDHHTIGIGRQTSVGRFAEVLVLEALVIHDLHFDMEVAVGLLGHPHPLLNLFPIGHLVMLGNKYIKGVRLVVGQCRGIHVGLVVHLLERFLHLHPRCRRHIGALVQHPVYRSHRHACPDGNVLDSDFVCHFLLVCLFAKITIKVELCKSTIE